MSFFGSERMPCVFEFILRREISAYCLNTKAEFPTYFSWNEKRFLLLLHGVSFYFWCLALQVGGYLHARLVLFLEKVLIYFLKKYRSFISNTHLVFGKVKSDFVFFQKRSNNAFFFQSISNYLLFNSCSDQYFNDARIIFLFTKTYFRFFFFSR